jgi:hypothetical protein
MYSCFIAVFLVPFLYSLNDGANFTGIILVLDLNSRYVSWTCS